jgi:hypothetical protein
MPRGAEARGKQDREAEAQPARWAWVPFSYHWQPHSCPPLAILAQDEGEEAMCGNVVWTSKSAHIMREKAIDETPFPHRHPRSGFPVYGVN